MQLSGDANWKQILLPALRNLTLVKYGEEEGDFDSLVQDLHGNLDALYQARVAELVEQLKQEMAENIAELLWDTTKSSDVDRMVAAEAGKVLAEKIGVESLVDEVNSLNAVVMSAKSTEAFKSVLGRSARTYYFVDVEGHESIKVWPGSGRYSEELRVVLHSAVFQKHTSSPKLLIDKSGSVSGESLDGEVFTVYSEAEFLSKFGRKRMNEVLNAANM